MSTYIKLFETTAQYTEYMGGEPYLPNVSLCKDNLDKPIHYTALVPVSSITLDKTSIQINGSTTLTATILPLDASNKNVTWTSSDTSKVTIDGSGSTVTLNCIDVGSSTITCTSVSDPSISATCSVTVTSIAATGIELDEQDISLTIGETTTLTATVLPPNATNKDVTWSSDNKYVLGISSNGSTATLNAKGWDDDYATVTCTLVSDPSIKATCLVEVTPIPVEEVSIDDRGTGWKNLEKYGTLTLTATVTPSNASNKALHWESSDESIATVDYNSDRCIVTAKNIWGDVEITVQSMENPSISDSITIAVPE